MDTLNASKWFKGTENGIEVYLDDEGLQVNITIDGSLQSVLKIDTDLNMEVREQWTKKCITDIDFKQFMNEVF